MKHNNDYTFKKLIILVILMLSIITLVTLMTLHFYPNHINNDNKDIDYSLTFNEYGSIKLLGFNVDYLFEPEWGTLSYGRNNN